MQQTENNNLESRTSNLDDDTINLLDYLEVIVRRKRLIICTTLAAFVLSIGVSLLLPKIYSSTAKILPPQQDQGLMGMMMGQMGGMAGSTGTPPRAGSDPGGAATKSLA